MKALPMLWTPLAPTSSASAPSFPHELEVDEAVAEHCLKSNVEPPAYGEDFGGPCKYELPVGAALQPCNVGTGDHVRVTYPDGRRFVLECERDGVAEGVQWFFDVVHQDRAP